MLCNDVIKIEVPPFFRLMHLSNLLGDWRSDCVIENDHKKRMDNNL